MKERVNVERASEKKAQYSEKGQTKGAFETIKLKKIRCPYVYWEYTTISKF